MAVALAAAALAAAAAEAGKFIVKYSRGKNSLGCTNNRKNRMEITFCCLLHLSDHRVGVLCLVFVSCDIGFSDVLRGVCRFGCFIFVCNCILSSCCRGDHRTMDVFDSA